MKFRLIAAFAVASMLVAGCGGGGGVSGVTPAPASGSGGSSSGGASQGNNDSLPRSLAGAAIDASASTVSMVSSLEQGAAAYASATTSEPMSSQGSTPTCVNGTERSYTYTSTGNGTGKGQLSLKQFYDAACTQLWKDTELSSIYPGMNGTGTATGYEAVYTQSPQTLYTYQTINTSTVMLNGTKTQFSEYKNESFTEGGTPFASFGWTCTYGQYPDINCDRANDTLMPAVNSNPAYGIGYAAVVNGSVTEPSEVNGCNQWSVYYQYAGSDYLGGTTLGILGDLTTPADTPPAWSIANGSLVSKLTGTVNLQFDCSPMLRNETITINDAADNMTATLNYTAASGNAPYGLTGTVMQGKTTVGTMTLNLAGNGTINYADGTKDWVINWTITDQNKTVGGNPSYT